MWSLVKARIDVALNENKNARESGCKVDLGEVFEGHMLERICKVSTVKMRNKILGHNNFHEGQCVYRINLRVSNRRTRD